MRLTTIPEDEAVDEPLRPPPIGTYTYVPPEDGAPSPFAGTVSVLAPSEDFEAILFA